MARTNGLTDEGVPRGPRGPKKEKRLRAVQCGSELVLQFGEKRIKNQEYESAARFEAPMLISRAAGEIPVTRLHSVT